MASARKKKKKTKSKKSKAKKKSKKTKAKKTKKKASVRRKTKVKKKSKKKAARKKAKKKSKAKNKTKKKAALKKTKKAVKKKTTAKKKAKKASQKAKPKKKPAKSKPILKIKTRDQKVIPWEQFFTPLSDRIVVVKDKSSEMTAGGIYIPSSARTEPNRGEVVLAGKGFLTEKGKLKELDVEVGDKVIYNDYASANAIEMNGCEVLILRETEIIGKFMG